MVFGRLKQLGRLLSRRRPSPAPEPSAGAPNLTPPPPATLFIIINNACNLRCKMCDVGQKNRDSQFFQVMCPDDERQLDMAALRKLIAEVREFKPLIAVTSTEPLMFKDLFVFAREVKQAGMAFQLTTNGLLLPRCADEVVESGVDSLWISLDGPPEVHNEIRGHPKSFQNAVQGLRDVDRLARQHGIDIQRCVNFSYSNHNCGSLIAFLECMSDLPVQQVTVSHMNYVTRDMAEAHNALHGTFCQATTSSIVAADPRAVDTDVMWREIQQAKQRSWPFQLAFSPDLDDQGVRDFYGRPEIVVRSPRCAAPWSLAQLAANGDWIVSTRCFLKSMGNLYEESFMETWHGREYQQFRQWILDHAMSPACTRCCAVL